MSNVEELIVDEYFILVDDIDHYYNVHVCALLSPQNMIAVLCR